MDIKNWLNSLSVENKSLHYKLILVFSLFFLVPVFGFLYFGVKYDILDDNNISFFFIVLLIMYFFGFIVLRKIFDSIVSVARSASQTIAENIAGAPVAVAADELQGIVTSFQTIQQELRTKINSLEKKTSEIVALKEISELCYITFNQEDLLYITLERALKLTNADIGSILIFEDSQKKTFIIEATIGQDEHIKRGDRIDYDTSIAKYAVINKSPLLVENIETDIRFGRQSRLQFATKSFICMPLKTISDVVGVLTISRKKTDLPFTQADVDVLIPLISNAVFTYDNLRLLKETEENKRLLKSLGIISHSLNSSLRGGDLFHSICREIKENIPYESAVILGIEKDAADRMFIVDFMTFTSATSANIFGDKSFSFTGSSFDKAFKQQYTVVIEDTDKLTHPVDREFFINHGCRSAVITPLIVEDRIVGLLVLCNVLPEALCGIHKFIDRMSAGLALALERERLLFSMAKRDQELETVRQVGNALSTSTFDMEKVLKYTMDMIRVAVNVEAGTLMLMEAGELKYQVAFNLDMEMLRGLKIKLGQGIAGHAAANGKTIIASDAVNHPHFSGVFDKISGFKTRSVLCVPMISGGKVTGVIEVLNKVDGVFDENDCYLLQSIATSVTIALENARLYRETVAMAENERSIRNMFQKFVPKEVVDKIILGTMDGKPLVDEYKNMTLLNIDIRGFSKFSKNLGPQKTVAFLNYFFSTMGEIVFKHHGIVDKYLGDGLLAIFGAPVSSAADADNAIAAALDMQHSLAGINEHFEGSFNMLLSTGISIHTGEVVVGNIGFDKKIDYTVIGDPVNFVFKLQTMCKKWPNSILITEKTRDAAKIPVNVEEAGTFEVDATMGKLKIFRLLGQG